MLQIGIDSITTPISKKQYSHRGSWAYIWANQLKSYFEHFNIPAEITVLDGKSSWDDFNCVYLYHGMEFNGKALNLFDGENDKNLSRLMRVLSRNDTNLYSLDISMPDFGRLAKRRVKNVNCPDNWKNADWDAVSKKCSEIGALTQADVCEHLEYDTLILGDSHTNSVYKARSVISRNDGQTLYGALNKGLSSFIAPFNNRIKNITLYFGNIDIRHHLMRQEDPQKSLIKLLEEYERQIIGLNMHNVELISVLPIENESRKISKTFGSYKGTPFFGSWSERTELVKLFNAQLQSIASRNNWQFYSHPEHFKNDLGELDFGVMEKPQSVHLSQEFYRWDLRADCPNKKLEPRHQTSALSW